MTEVLKHVDACGRGIHAADDCPACWPDLITQTAEFVAGDPCATCGSTKTSFEDGIPCCQSCGASDADE